MPLKIRFIIHDLCQGGAEKVLVNLVNNMNRDKFDITVMTLFDVGVNKQFLKQHIKYKSCFKRPIPGNSHLLKIFSPEMLYGLLIKDNYDIVVSYLEGPTARIVGGAPKGVKTVSWIHSTISTQKALSASFRNEKEANRCYERADAMVFVSESVKDSFLSVCNTKNNFVLYNTNESESIKKKALEPIENFDFSNSFNWCAVGKLVTIKGYDRMLRIQKRLLDEGYNVHFHALGIGEEEDSLKDFCKSSGIENSVTFWGYQTNPYKYVSKCDLFVCASLSEGFSTAATEALIVGTPVCTVEVSGMKEMLGKNDEYGIVTKNDENDLYNAIKQLLDDPALLKHYKMQANIRGETFSTKNTVNAVEQFLDDLYNGVL